MFLPQWNIYWSKHHNAMQTTKSIEMTISANGQKHTEFWTCWLSFCLWLGGINSGLKSYLDHKSKEINLQANTSWGTWHNSASLLLHKLLTNIIGIKGFSKLTSWNVVLCFFKFKDTHREKLQESTLQYRNL